MVTGAGRAWCAGADLTYRAGEADLPVPNGVLPNSTPLTIRKPIIAAINGPCVLVAEEMADLGLVNSVVPDAEVVSSAVSLARSLANNASPASMATIKRQVMMEQSMDGFDALDHANGLMYESLRGVDVGEGVMSFLEKREANFEPLGSGTMFEWMDETGD